MKKNSKLIVIILLIIIFIGIVLIFNKKDKTKDEKYKIGAVMDLTGSFAMYGGWVKRGIDLAYEEIIKEGTPLELYIEDGMSNVKTSITASTKLIDLENISTLIGASTSSSSIMAIAPITEKNKVIMFVPIASSPSISDAGEYIIRNRVNGIYEIIEIIKVAKSKFNYKDIAIVALNNEAGKVYVDYFKTYANREDITISTIKWINAGDIDFKTIAAQLKKTNSQAVFYGGSVIEGAKLIFNCKLISYLPQWFSVSSLWSDELIKIAGDAAEGLVIACEAPDTSTNEYKMFRSTYYSKYNEEPTIYSINGYDALKFLVDVIDSAGYNPELIKNYFDNKTFYGVGGKMTFNEKGDAIRKISLLEVKNQQFIDVTD